MHLRHRSYPGLTVPENNLALQEPLYKLRSDTKDAFDEAKRLEARWKELEREQRELYQVRTRRRLRRAARLTCLQRHEPQFLLMRLKHATTAQDDLSEATATRFIKSTPDATQNGKDVDDFVREFRELRRTYHRRVILGDRWTMGDVAGFN